MSAVRDQWWLAVVGDRLIWARLREREAGTAEVFDCDGRTLGYDSPDSARAALLEAEYRALDGLDDTDAHALGLDLATLTPPQADSEESLRLLMIARLRR